MEGKVALLLGGSSSMGLATARLLGPKGVKLVITYNSGKEKVESVLKEIEKQGGQGIAIKTDTYNIEEIKDAFQQTLKAYKKLDIFVYYSGIIRFKLIQDSTEEDFDETFKCNVKGLFVALKECGKLMENNGRIVSIASSTKRQMLPYYGTYSASKAAVAQLLRVFAQEIGHKGITVNCVLPGPVASPMFNQGKTQEQIDKIKSFSPFHRIGEAEEIASVVAFLVSTEASWVNAQEIGVNGGAI